MGQTYSNQSQEVGSEVELQGATHKALGKDQTRNTKHQTQRFIKGTQFLCLIYGRK